MITSNRLIILFFAAAFILFSCKKKDDKVNNCDLTEANFAGSYKVESIKYKLSPAAPEVDGTSILDPCEIDDITTFNANHTFTYTDAGTQCTTPGDYNGTWSLNGNTLNFDGRFPTINVFDCTGFTITDTSSHTDGDQIILKLKRQ